MDQASTRPTKKQQELLKFVEQFITEHGYGPSYREIMRARDYASVATVALHVNSLIARGHLHKRENSARSLELVDQEQTTRLAINQVKASDEKWLVDKIDHLFTQAERSRPEEHQLDELYVLIGALKVLGLDGAAQSFLPRLSTLKNKQPKN